MGDSQKIGNIGFQNNYEDIKDFFNEKTLSQNYISVFSK